MPHPLLVDSLLVRQRLKLRAKGFSRSQINAVMDGVTGDTVQSLADAVGVSIDPNPAPDPTPAPTPTPPAHPILAWIAAFLASPAGQALEAALEQFLLHLLIP